MNAQNSVQLDNFTSSSYVECYYYEESEIELYVQNNYDGYMEFNGELIFVNVLDVLTPNNSSVEVYQTLNDMSANIINEYNNFFDSVFSDAVRKASATAHYNCHSYAWHSQNIATNDYWMNDPSNYYKDNGYIEVDTPRSGDIICYFDNKETPENFLDDKNLHSGIVIEYYQNITSNNICGNSNKVKVKSKWGPAGLYEHFGDYCPYTVAYGGDADYVKYYRPKTNNTYILDNYSETINNNIILIGTEQIVDSYQMYEINVNYTRNYEFVINANSALDVRLYDEHMQLIDVLDINSNLNGVNIVEQLYKNKIYYLRIAFVDSNLSGTVSVQINFDHYLSIGNNNILSGYIYNIEDYVYTNNISAGFFKITLNATNSSGTIEYPEGCIKVYADEAQQQLLARIETIFYTLDAETQGDSNNLIVFLEYGQSYYINIDLPDTTYSSISINVERLNNTYDILTNVSDVENIILDGDTTAYGDFIQRIEVHQAGTYTILFEHNGPQSEENLSGQVDPLYLYYTFYKEVSSPAEQFGDLTIVIPHMATTVGNTVEFTLNLQPGVYYIGYYNKLNNEPMSISITS